MCLGWLVLGCFCVVLLCDRTVVVVLSLRKCEYCLLLVCLTFDLA